MNSFNLENIIENLLWNEECVIVPELGAFITRSYQPSLNKATHIIKPSAKSVFFNQSITQTDGMIANYASEKLGITYNDACELIKQEVNGIKKLILNGERVKWSKIGTFFANNEKLYFIPEVKTNFDKKSYGLPSIQLKKLEQKAENNQPAVHIGKEEVNSKLEEEFSKKYQNTALKEEHDQPLPLKKERNSLKNILLWSAAALMAIAISFVAYHNESRTYATQKALTFDFNPTESGIIEEAKTDESFNEEQAFNNDGEYFEDTEDGDDQNYINEKATPDNNNASGEEYFEAVEEEEPIETSTDNFTNAADEQDELTTNQTTQISFNTNDPYHIIIYHSLVDANVASFIAENSKGTALRLNNSIIRRVSILSSDDFETINKALLDIKAEYPKAYILDKSKYEKL
jgi:hypothetical protein